jgi:hypothetical protein
VLAVPALRVEVGGGRQRHLLPACGRARPSVRPAAVATRQGRDAERHGGRHDHERDPGDRHAAPGQEAAPLLDRLDHRRRLAVRPARTRDLHVERLLEVGEHRSHVRVAELGVLVRGTLEH